MKNAQFTKWCPKNQTLAYAHFVVNNSQGLLLIWESKLDLDLPLCSAAAVASDLIVAPINTPCCQLRASYTRGTPVESKIASVIKEREGFAIADFATWVTAVGTEPYTSVPLSLPFYSIHSLPLLLKKNLGQNFQKWPLIWSTFIFRRLIYNTMDLFFGVLQFPTDYIKKKDGLVVKVICIMLLSVLR